MTRVCQEIGGALSGKVGYHVVAVRSTMVPGSLSATLLPALAAAMGTSVPGTFGACVNPEFMREGSGIEDYDHPSKIVIGETESQAGDRIAELYRSIRAPIFRMTVEMAELTKYIDNSWRALKVTFANEIGAMCAAYGIDAFEAMRIFTSDQKQNISPAYLTPGFAFGGSCLPKDLRALRHEAKLRNVAVPVLDAVAVSNAHRIESTLRRVLAAGKRRVGVCGLVFKPGTDDLRESPYVLLAAALIREGCEVRLFDQNILAGKIGGQNLRVRSEPDTSVRQDFGPEQGRVG